MSEYGEIWRLPGPGGFAREVARLADRGQHVLVVLPRYIAEDSEYSDGLAVAIMNELADRQRLYPSETQGSLIRSLGFNVVEAFEDAPVTVSALISHRDGVGRTFVCNAVDLDPSHRDELPAFLARLDDESRPVPASERCTFIFVMGREMLPTDPASVGTSRLWYWDRVNRWDVAAYLSARSTRSNDLGVLGEVRLETIIAIARWDFVLAIEIADSWLGGELELVNLVKSRAISAPLTPIRKTGLQQPADSHLDEWDLGLVDSWHGVPGFKPASIATQSSELVSLVWSAQARVLLPWIEIRRVRMEEMVRSKLGPIRMRAAVDEFATRFPGVDVDQTLVELATLTRIIGARLGHSDARLRDSGLLLVAARNRLAHLAPLTADELELLVAQCTWMD